MLTKISEEYKIGKKKYAKFQCECGNIIELQPHVANKRKKSCGCKEHKLSKFQGIVKTKHPLYHSFKQMKYRKNGRDPNFTLEDLFDFAEKNGYELGMMVYAIDPEKPYSKTNIKFLKNRPIIKQNLKKSKETHIKKYGKYFTQTDDYKQLKKKTCLEKYGVEHPSQSEVVKAKNKLTIEKNKKQNPNYYNDIQTKTIATNLIKYGYEYVTKVPNIRIKQIENTIKKYGKLFNITNRTEENSFGKFLMRFGEFKSNYNILNGKEIDYFSNELMTGFEYCGLYWHTNKSPEPRKSKYHYNKYKKCLDSNIRLFTIWASEWKEKRSQVESYIRSALGCNEITYYARKCEIQQIEGKIGREFIETYHIQGQKRIGKFYVGCYYNNELVGCISLNTHHRKSSELVLDRMVFKSNTTVVGGASKIFKKCIEWAKSQGYKKITTWSDNRWSQGNVYSKLGFILDKELKPDYSYVNLKNPKKLISKQSLKGKKDNHLAKIWDCGKKRWIIYL